MGMIEDIGLFLQAATSMDLDVGGNLYLNYLPDLSTGTIVSITEYPGGPPERTFGTGIQWEDARFQVIVRGLPDESAGPRLLADQIMMRLSNTGDGTLEGASSGFRYMNIEALQSPFPIGQDNQGRLRFANNYAAWPVRST